MWQIMEVGREMRLDEPNDLARSFQEEGRGQHRAAEWGCWPASTSKSHNLFHLNTALAVIFQIPWTGLEKRWRESTQQDQNESCESDKCAQLHIQRPPDRENAMNESHWRFG